MHLRADAYQTWAHIDDEGRNVFAVALWRLDRIREHRAGAGTEWSEAHSVVEFARARALERLRRYRDAARAYARVAAHPGVLAGAAQEHQRMMEVFASLAEASVASAVHPEAVHADPEASLAAVEAWSTAWNGLAASLSDPGHAALARIEAEFWDESRVEHFALLGRTQSAIASCQRLIQVHTESKSYPRHMIRLGDLYAESARREYLRARSERRELDIGHYEQSLERAFAAYELASEARRPRLQREAQSKIEALLSYHEGVRSDVQ